VLLRCVASISLVPALGCVDALFRALLVHRGTVSLGGLRLVRSRDVTRRIRSWGTAAGPVERRSAAASCRAASPGRPKRSQGKRARSPPRTDE
jgi:hypothetical protein